MNTIYKPGDRVITTVKGTEVEASVVRVTVDIEVSTPDGRTWWRAISKLRPAVGVEPEVGKLEQTETVASAATGAVESQTETTREEIFGEAAETAAKREPESPAPSAHMDAEAASADKRKRRNRKRKR